MGNCCCQSHSQDIYEGDETDDRRNLLGSPDGESTRGPKYTEEKEKLNHSIEKIDEQGKLDQILEKTANNYIDVPALNSPLEQPGYAETTALYANTSKEVLNKYNFKERDFSLLTHSSQVEKVLCDEPLSVNDRTMVNEFSSSIVKATTSIKVNYDENIVIPFDI